MKRVALLIVACAVAFVLGAFAQAYYEEVRSP